MNTCKKTSRMKNQKQTDKVKTQTACSGQVDTVVRRAPILLSAHTVALILIYSRHDHMDDIWTSDVPQYYEDVYNVHEAAAKQFVEQLDGHWCVKFMEALIKEIRLRIKKHKEEIRA